MPMTRHYHCSKCGENFEILWRDSKEAQNTATCSCKHKAKRLYGAQFLIDDWSPEGNHSNQAQRDIDHFKKKRVKGGRYIDTKTQYKDDQQRQGIPVNIKEI